MPLLVEQRQEDIRLAFEVHTNSSIDLIRVASSKWTSVRPEEHADARVRLQFKIAPRILPSPSNVLRVQVAFGTYGSVDAPEGGSSANAAKVLSIECVYEVDYLLNEGFLPTPEQAKAFKDGNAVFNAWPFYREFVLNAAQRMGVPPLTLPFLKIQPKPSVKEKVKKKKV